MKSYRLALLLGLALAGGPLGALLPGCPGASRAIAQEDTAAAAPQDPRDTSAAGQRRDMPKLEIPEITIVGKKAITLPFARKGEVFDIPLYEAPPPDSSLLEERPPIGLPPGRLPRYEAREDPWRASAEGLAGNRTTFGFRGYVDYHTHARTLSLFGGFKQTDGHVTNSDGSIFDIAGAYNSLISSDNDFLRKFRLSADIGYAAEEYGMFGVIDSGAVRRDRESFLFGAGVSSLDRSGIAFDISLRTDVLAIDDDAPGADSGITAASPVISVLATDERGDFGFLAGFDYTLSSLDYPGGGPSPSLLGIMGGVRFIPAPQWSMRAGAEISSSYGSEMLPDASSTQIGGYVEAEYEMNETVTLGGWFRREANLVTYAKRSTAIPYLVREADIRPEFTDYLFGGSFWYNSGGVTFRAAASFEGNPQRSIVVADSGRISLEYAAATEGKLDLSAGLEPLERLSVTLTSTLRSAREKGSSSQLPMVPVATAGARGAYEIVEGWSADASLTWWSEQNADRAGTRKIVAPFVMNAGVSTTLVPRLHLRGAIDNLFDSDIVWWEGYPAPGVTLSVTAKYHF